MVGACTCQHAQVSQPNLHLKRCSQAHTLHLPQLASLTRSLLRLHPTCPHCRHGVHCGRLAQSAEQRQRGGSTGGRAPCSAGREPAWTAGLGSGACLVAGCWGTCLGRGCLIAAAVSPLPLLGSNNCVPIWMHAPELSTRPPNLAPLNLAPHTGRGAVAGNRHGGGSGHLPGLLPGCAAAGKAVVTQGLTDCAPCLPFVVCYMLIHANPNPCPPLRRTSRRGSLRRRGQRQHSPPWPGRMDSCLEHTQASPAP